MAETKTQGKLNFRKLFIANIDRNMAEVDLEPIFSKWVGVAVKLIRDRETDRSKGYCFATFTNRDSAKEALTELHDKMINGRKLIVEYARWRPPLRKDRERGSHP